MRAIILSRLVRPLALTLTILLIAAGASAQLVSDGTTATINGTATNIAGFLIIGNTGPNTTLIVTNGGNVTSGSIGIGGNTSSTNNLVAVSGVGSQMTTPGGGSVFRIGDGSAFNRLLISEGGAVTTGYGVVGYPVGASNNSVLVTDSGSAWTNDFLFIGEGGASNSVTVANGGQVQSFGSIIGVVASASNNWVSVTGTNSLWTTASTLNIGGAGEGSRLQVSSNGTVIAATMTLGDQVTSSNNVLSIAAGNVMVTNASGTGVLDVRSGKVEFTAGNLIADELLVTNETSQFIFNSGTLVTRSATMFYGINLDSGATGPAGATIANPFSIAIPSVPPATLSPSTINVSNLLGTLSRVTVTVSNLSHGASSELRLLLVGPNGESVVLMGAAGLFLPTTNVTLTFDDAAANPTPPSAPLTTGTYFPTNYIPGNFTPPAPAGPYTNQLAVFNGSNPNGTWSLFVDDPYEFNSGSIAAGWSLNLVTTLPPVTWDVRSNTTPSFVGNFLTVGSNKPNSTLLITNGGTLLNDKCVVGWNESSTNNRVLLSGPDSRWTNSVVISIGEYGGANEFVVSNGAVLSTSRSLLGIVSDANTAVVTGTGSLWSCIDVIEVGSYGAGNQLVVSNGGTVEAQYLIIGYDPSAQDNRVIVDGGTLRVTELGAFDIQRGTCVFNAGLIEADYFGLTNNASFFEFNGGMLITRHADFQKDILMGSSVGSSSATWIMGSGDATNTVPNLVVGYTAANNTLLITNGGTLFVSGDFIDVGETPAAPNNRVLVSDPGSLLHNNGNLSVGYDSSGNQLVVSNGAAVVNQYGSLGLFGNANTAVVTGAGSVWSNHLDLSVGSESGANLLLATDGGTVSAANIFLGAVDRIADNRVIVAGGTLRATNALGNSKLSISGGTNVFNAGLIETDNLEILISSGSFAFNGGTLNTRAATIANGALFTVGNGSSAATYRMTGTNTHAFTSGMRIANNGVLAGNGNLNSVLTVASGGTLSPGTSLGRILLFYAPALQGNVAMDISKTGTTLASDRLDCSVALPYAGSLTVNKLGPDALALGDSFKLFSAPGYSGAFNSISLPSLPVGLAWTNRLAINGTIAVVTNQPAPQITNLTKTGTNLIFNVTGGAASGSWHLLTSTNVALPLANWITNRSGAFDGSGNANFTNGINATEPQRYFRIKTP
jgi:T5SS/PEP-CTERM-associated repeat protein